MSEQLVRRHFELATATDQEEYLALFAPDAVVEDENTQRHGIAEIRAWRSAVPPVTYTVLSVESDDTPDNGASARAEVAGDFPGSPVTLGYRFEFATGLITRLTIRP